MGKGKKRRNQDQHEHADKYAVDSQGRAERSSPQHGERESERNAPHSSPEVDDFGQGPEHYEGR